MTVNGRISKAILRVGQLLALNDLVIPVYQRPYKWTARNVSQLFSDLALHRERSSYRLGTIVFHEDKDGRNVVDGQQRTVTLLLAVRALIEFRLAGTGRLRVERKDLRQQLEELRPALGRLSFTSITSKTNIFQNYQEIARIVSRSDFSEAHDLAAAQPQKLAALKDLFWAEAATAGILPIHGSEGGQKGRPDPNAGRALFTYHGPIGPIPESAAPGLVGHSFTIRAQVTAPADGGQGVIAVHGGRFGGYSLFLDQGRPRFTYNLTPAHMSRIAGTAPLTAGRHDIGLRFVMDREAPTSGATATLLVDGKKVARGRIDRTFALVVSHTEDFEIGQDSISPVDPAYDVVSSHFTGTIEQVDISLP
jgi:hypothetical protein